MTDVIVQPINEIITLVEPVDTQDITLEVLTPLPTEVIEVWVPGLPGPPGVDGVAGGTVLEFTQDVGSNNWIIPHPFDSEPSVRVFDQSGQRVGVQIVDEISLHRVRVTPDLAFSGKAILSG